MPPNLRTSATRADHYHWLAALALMLVLAQSMGLMHRLAHGPNARPGASAQPAAQAPDSSEHWLKALFAGHEEGYQCPLFDPLTQPAGPTVALLTLPLQPACPPPLPSHGDFVARRAALFDARGPPAFR